jgi:flagellar hook protein FlgE
MLGTIYVGLAGMNAYAKGLDVISNNVANLNTVGFKAGQASFAEVVYRNGDGAVQGSPGSGTRGAGVHVGEESQNFRQGDTQETGNSLDAAVQGTGFFVLERDGQRFYTRAGQFVFKDGILVEKNSGAQVMVSSDAQAIGSLSIDAFHVFPPKATAEAKLQGNLARTGEATFTAPLTVNDTTGGTQTLKVRFVRDGNNPLVWAVNVLDSKDVTLATGSLKFNSDGTPAADNEAIAVTVTPTDLSPFTFTLNLGAAGTYAGVYSLISNPTSGVSLLKQDGQVLGTLSADGATFDERGNLELTYSNGEKKKIGRLVLARFDGSGDLDAIGGGMYVTKAGRTALLSAGMESGVGRVAGGKLEMSNVELTEQFTNLIIIQRGYQASSQMTSVANEMLQQLLSMQDRR